MNMSRSAIYNYCKPPFSFYFYTIKKGALHFYYIIPRTHSPRMYTNVDLILVFSASVRVNKIRYK